jgi:hypothetical protein
MQGAQYPPWGTRIRCPVNQVFGRSQIVLRAEARPAFFTGCVASMKVKTTACGGSCIEGMTGENSLKTALKQGQIFYP